MTEEPFCSDRPISDSFVHQLQNTYCNSYDRVSEIVEHSGHLQPN